jgi:hypothetical protein
VTSTYAPPEGYTPRLRIGPSVLDQASRCMRSWGLRYLLGYDAQDPTWAEIAEHVYDPLTRLWRREGFPDWPSRKRSTALGTEAHAIVEGHYMGTLTGASGAAKWASFPGQVAQAWLDVMPSPEECDEVYTELGVCLWNDDPENPDDPPIEGTSDLLLRVKITKMSSSEYAETRGWLVGDWKTTKSTTRGDFDYQPLAYKTKRVVKKDREGNEYEILVPPLFTNRQAVIYPLAAMRRLDLDAIPGRWAYSITDPKKRREARATDFVQTRENAEALVKEYFAEARVLKGHFETYTTRAEYSPVGAAEYVASLPANTDECDSYGGCPHAWDRGGACTARRSLGARIAAAKPCASPAVDVPLEALLQRSVSMSMSTTPVSSWKAAAARFAAQRAQAPAGPPPEDNPPLAAPIEHNAPMYTPPAETVVTSPDPQPEAPSPEPRASDGLLPGEKVDFKPKGRKGRPPGSKNKTKIPGHGSPEYEALPMCQQADADQARAYDANPELYGDPPEINPDEFKDNPDYEPAPKPTFRDFTLSEIAAAAKATGAEITIHFSGKVA